MPCGGIYPIKGSWVESLQGPIGVCWQCNKSEPRPDHWCEEWDTPIHGSCVKDFLMSDEGKIVIRHGHEIHIELLDGTIEEIQAESRQ